MLVMEDYWGSYTEAFRGDPELRGRSYRECADGLFRRGIYYGDSYLHGFSEHGLSAVQVVPDCEPLQRRWAAERGLWVPPDWTSRAPFRWWWSRRFGRTPQQWARDRILLDQVAAHRPRYLWFFSGTPISADLLRRCREFADFLVLWWACPLQAGVPYSEFDIVFSGIPDLVQFFRTIGVQASYLPHAFDGRILGRVVPARPRAPKIGFVGAASVHHVERLLLLDLLARHVDLDLYGSGWDMLPAESVLRSRHRGPAWGDRVYEVYGSYLLTVHHNINVAGRSLSAKRLFEATGMGACVLAQEPSDQDRLFEPDDEIVTYRTREECVAKARHLLTHVEQAERIGAAARERTLKDHQYSNRVVTIVEQLENLEGLAPGPVPRPRRGAD